MQLTSFLFIYSFIYHRKININSFPEFQNILIFQKTNEKEMFPLIMIEKLTFYENMDLMHYFSQITLNPLPALTPAL